MKKINLSSAKTLGIIGFIILLLLPFFFKRYMSTFIVSLAYYVLVLLALNDISSKLDKKEIFSNFLTASLISVLGGVVAIIIAILGGISFLAFSLRGLAGLLSASVILYLLLIYAIAVISAYFVKKSFKDLGEVLNNSYFKTGSDLYFIGAILLIVVVGFLIMYIGEIFFLIGFLTMQDEIEIEEHTPQELV
ncbi:MAG: DUF996 domain-containing protein [Caldisericaceae bacterium]